MSNTHTWTAFVRIPGGHRIRVEETVPAGLDSDSVKRIIGSRYGQSNLREIGLSGFDTSRQSREANARSREEAQKRMNSSSTSNNNNTSSYSSSTGDIGDIVGGVVALVGLVGWTLSTTYVVTKWTASTTWNVTKWAAPKVWKGCEITSNGVEWLLTNTR